MNLIIFINYDIKYLNQCSLEIITKSNHHLLTLFFDKFSINEFILSFR